jgi:acyl carrier protein
MKKMISDVDIKNIIQETVVGLDTDELSNDKDFTEVGIDSLDHLSILLALEEKLGIKKIPDDKIDECRSISGILNHISDD